MSLLGGTLWETRDSVAACAVGVLAFAAAALACDTSSEAGSASGSETQVELTPSEGASIDDPIQPIPLFVELDTRKVALGERLFRDPILSPNGRRACVTCHEMGMGGVDRKAKSHMDDQPAMVVNTPTVYNAAFNFKLHWEGSFSSLEDQLKVPVESPAAMATTFPDIVTRLNQSAEYRAAFAEIYPDGITVDTFKNAVVEYEKSLYTPNAPFDKFLRGEEDALTPDQRAGYALFKSYGCVSCHQGINVGGNMYQKLGVLRDFFGERGNPTEGDLGLYRVTKREEDKHVFRVPSLRNVAVTQPYLHDGSAATLAEAVQVMARYQLGRNLDDEQVRLLVEFLGSLTGEYQGRRLQ